MSFWSDIAPVAGTAIGFSLGGPVGAMIGAGIGGTVSSSSNAKDAADAQREANEQNIAMQRETNAQSIDLADRAHQREVADLKAAGLNPVLSAGGQGAKTPTLTAPQMESLAPTILSSSKQQIDRQMATAQVMQAYTGAQQQASQAQVNTAQVANIKAQTARQEMENAAIAEGAERRRFEDEYRNKRPSWIKERGIDIKDFFSTISGAEDWRPRKGISVNVPSNYRGR